jgi:hypothetical protein
MKRFRFVLLAFCALIGSAPSPCAATIFTGSISRSDPPAALLVARFNFREYTESKYSIQASSGTGFFALFDDETKMLQHLEKGLRSRNSDECSSYLMNGKGVGPYRALSPAALERGWNEGIVGNYCRDWFFVFFNCHESLEVPSYRIETLTDGGSQLPCGKEYLPLLLAVFAAVSISFVVFMLQRHGLGVFDVQSSCCIVLYGCAGSGLACVLMGSHYFYMRINGIGFHAANFLGRVVLQGAQLALLVHALRFTAHLSLPRIWLSVAESQNTKVAFLFTVAAYAFALIMSLTSDSFESVIANAQPLNTFGVLLVIFQLFFAVFATFLYRKASRLEYTHTLPKLKCHSLVFALPWLWCLPLGTLLCLTVGSRDQLVAVYAVQLSLSSVYSTASALMLVDHVPNDDPQLFDEPRFFNDGL